jgi:hypothetical protein
VLHPADGRRWRVGFEDYFLGIRMERSARMFFWTSVVPAPIEV